MYFRSLSIRILAALAAAFLLVAPASAQDSKLTVFAAASLKNALDDANAAWIAQGKQVAVSYAGSNALARQIEEGAPADIFISADLHWMDYLQEKQLVKADTRSSLLGNRIVLIAPKDSAAAVRIENGFDLGAAVGGGKLAMANTDSVPAGRYGKAALEKLGAWDGVKDKIAQAENVRAALLLVSRGEAPFGIVYKTDAASDPQVTIVDTFPAGSHPPIVYPIAVVATSKNPDAKAYLAFLKSPAAAAAFEKQGFSVLD
jgi:molybdate transport system substrate-binding protein